MLKTNKGTDQSEKIELPKLAHEYDYRGNEEITITAVEFYYLREAVQQALKQGITSKYPSKTKWADVLTGQYREERPTDAEIKSQVVRLVTVPELTFNEENYVESYDAWVFPKVTDANQALSSIHSRMVETGVAVHMSVLQAELKAMQEKSKANGPIAPMPDPSIKEELTDEKPKATKKRVAKPKK